MAARSMIDEVVLAVEEKVMSWGLARTKSTKVAQSSRRILSSVSLVQLSCPPCYPVSVARLYFCGIVALLCTGCSPVAVVLNVPTPPTG
jgi:hypothetical protein